MAPSLSSSLSFQSKQISCTRRLSNVICVIFLIMLLAGSCSATRPGATLVVDNNKVSMTSFRRKYETGFRFHGQMFNFFPKGTPLPPSGPSKRHNSVVDSTHN
ncbi:hypothetical protein DITRI_Ditri02bG0199200 [Diplodiscus trichospermus]